VKTWSWAADLAVEKNFGVLHWLGDGIPTWAGAIVAVLLFDIWTYGWHRMNHRVPFFWRFHKVHHSDPNMDVTTANRFHFGEIILSSMLRVPVLILIGADLWHLALYEAILFPVVQFHHANVSIGPWMDRFLRLFITTPEMHKVHHSRWQPETDSNYTSLLSVWDRVFRSFRLRKDPHEISFGLDGYDSPDKQHAWGMLRTPVERRKLETKKT
jgi:sterol desaturase/sphingolipid hydroxylase (fatty acid hydroxylase superfamily)